jgi:hypothetical protein
VGLSLRILRAAYDVGYVRQLYHNRNEITVVARRGWTGFSY